jgi:serine/threonine protein kinase
MKTVTGTPPYMAPELRNALANGEMIYKYKESITDSYSLGIILL